MNRISRFATAVVVSGGLSLAGLGLATGTAQADPFWGPSYNGGNCPGGNTCTHWCPGDPLIPGSQVITWDWNICHDWYWNSEGVVRRQLRRPIRLLRRSLYRRIAPRGRRSWPRRGAVASSRRGLGRTPPIANL
jgi:hypothetical protein